MLKIIQRDVRDTYMILEADIHGVFGHRYADEVFTDCPVRNLRADLDLLPSLFDPGGIVQQTYFEAGTPIVAYKCLLLIFFFPAALIFNPFTLNETISGPNKTGANFVQ